MKLLAKKTMGLLLATLVAFGVVAGTTQAFAGGSAETDKQSDKYTEVNIQEPYMKDAELHVYSVKDDKGSPAAEITITYKNAKEFCSQLLGVREYTAAAKEGWVFKNWTYEQLLNGKDRGNYHALFYSFSESHGKKSTPYTSGKVISVNRTGTIGESALIKRIYKVYANLNPTITATAGAGGTITPAGKTEVQYGENQTYNFTAKEGYVIDSLKIDGVEQTVAPAASGSYEFKAVKSPHTIEVSFAKAYTITYTDGVDGKEIFKNQVTSGILSGSKTPKFTGTPSRAGYEFTGWNPTVAEKVTDNATYVAQWKRIQRTVTFKDGDKTPVTVKVETGRAINTDALTNESMPKDPTKADYTFKEWNTKEDGKGETFTGASVVKGDMTVYAIYTQDSVPTPIKTNSTVTFKDGDKTPVTVKVETGSAIDTDALADQSMPKDPTKADYTFKEWNTKENGKGETFTGESVVNGDMTVYAIYTKNSVPAPTPTPKPQPKTPDPKPQPKPQPKSHPETSAPASIPPTPELKLKPETPAPKPQPKLKSETLASKPQAEAAASKPQPEKQRIDMTPKTGESASYAGLLAALGFSIAGLAILCKKNMIKENNK